MGEDKKEEVCCCCEKHKERSDKEYRDLMNRLKRIEGQVRGIQGMLEKDAYCIDIREGNDDVIQELVNVLPKLMK